MLTAVTLGDQPVDPGFVRDLSALVSGLTQNLISACFHAGNCATAPIDHEQPLPVRDPLWASSLDPGDPIGYYDPKDPWRDWWNTLSAAQGRIVHRIGRDDLRPRDYYRSGAALEFERLSALVGATRMTKDPQGLVKTTISHGPYTSPGVPSAAAPLIQAWLDAGHPELPRRPTPWRTVAAIATAAAALGAGAAYYTRRRK
jgi:hypothetical protein